MDFESLSAVIAEAAQLLSGARVNRVYEAEPHDIVLVLRNRGRDFFLLLSPDRTMPRIHLVSRKPQARPSLHPFALYLKSRIAGGKMEAIGLLNSDRIVEMTFDVRGSRLRLLVELFGPSMNMVATDRDSVILNVYYPPAAGAAAGRLLMTGIQYAPPPQKGERPDKAEKAGKSGKHPPELDSSPNEEAERFFQTVLERRRFELLKGTLLSAARKARSRIERKLAALTADRDSSARAEDYRLIGELILSNLAHLHMGMKEATLAGPDSAPAVVPLDPRLSPTRNADRYFKRYKKAKSGRSVIEKMIAAAGEELSRVRSLEIRLESALLGTDLSNLQALMEQSGMLRSRARQGTMQKQSSPDPFRTISYRGWEILVGRNARGNDYLTTKIARDSDLWLHAEGMPGSHVVVRNPKGRDIPPDVLKRAAALAAHFSRGRSSGKVPVTYTLARWVRKPKGAKPGLVTLSERKTMMSVPQGEQNDDQ